MVQPLAYLICVWVATSWQVFADEAQIRAAQKPLVLPIDVDEQGLWGSNFAIGARESQRLNIAIDKYDSIFYPGDYKPSSEAQSYGREPGYVENLYQPYASSAYFRAYSDYIGIQGHDSLRARAQMMVLTKANPPEHLQVSMRDQLPLALTKNYTWLSNMCNGVLSQCRFGIAMANKTKGILVLGGIDESFHDGKFTTVPSYSSWGASGDIIVNEEVVTKQVVSGFQGAPADSVAVTFENYGGKIIGNKTPPEDIGKLFRLLNITTLQDGDSKSLRGYFPCDKPPKLGFNFPVSKNNRTYDKERTIYILPSALIAKQLGDNKCVSVLEGINTAGPNFDMVPEWLLGSSFFEGRYVDFRADTKSWGVADLRNADAILGVKVGGNTHSNVARPVTASGTSINFVAGIVAMLYHALWI